MSAHDVVIIGAGIAGMMAALEARKKVKDVVMVSKLHPLRSSSGIIQEGINAALAKMDSEKKHADDMIASSCKLADKEISKLLSKHAPNIVRQLEEYGLLFVRKNDNRIEQNRSRCCFTHGRTGHKILSTLYEQVQKSNIKCFNEFFLLSIVQKKGKCQGVLVLDIKKGKVKAIRAKSVVLATGNPCWMFEASATGPSSTGDGIAAAYRAKACLQNLEFVNMTPIALHKSNVALPSELISLGAKILTSSKKDITKSLSKKSSSNIALDLQKKKNLYLDLRNAELNKVDYWYPHLNDCCKKFTGLDINKDLIPIQPCAEFNLGGIKVDKKASTNIKGLYAAGSCACIGNGADTLEGNRLLETLVFARIAGIASARYALGKWFKGKIPEKQVKFHRQLLEDMKKSEGDEITEDILADLKETMQAYLDPAKDKFTLNRIKKALDKLQQRTENVKIIDSNSLFNTEMIALLELKNMVDVARLIVQAAIQREESRGLFQRSDFKKQDDKRYCMHTLLNQGINNKTQIAYQRAQNGK